jgi:hypothetical protein
MTALDEECANLLREGQTSRVFGYWEKLHRKQLADGEAGWQLYQELFGLVKAEAPYRAREFQERFADLLDQEFMARMLVDGLADAARKQRERPQNPVPFVNERRVTLVPQNKGILRRILERVLSTPC